MVLSAGGLLGRVQNARERVAEKLAGRLAELRLEVFNQVIYEVTLAEKKVTLDHLQVFHQMKIINNRFFECGVRFLFHSKTPILKGFVLGAFCVPETDNILDADELYVQGSVLLAAEFP